MRLVDRAATAFGLVDRTAPLAARLVDRIRQRNYRVDRSGDLGYRRATAQAVGVSAASR